MIATLISSNEKGLSANLLFPWIRTSRAKTKLSKECPLYIKFHRMTVSPLQFFFVFYGVVVYGQIRYIIPNFLLLHIDGKFCVGTTFL